MKHLLLTLLLAMPALAAPAQAVYPHQRTPPRPAAKVYVCGGGSAYAYHSSAGCAGLNRCSHGVTPVTVAEAEQLGRRPCKKCY